MTLGISNAANIDRLSWTINAAVSIDTEMVGKFVVVVVISTPAQTFLIESVVLAFRELDIDVVPLAFVSNLGNAALVGQLLFEQSVCLPFSLVEADLHALLRFARHSIRHHHTLFIVGQSNGHEGEG